MQMMKVIFAMALFLAILILNESQKSETSALERNYYRHSITSLEVKTDLKSVGLGTADNVNLI